MCFLIKYFKLWWILGRVRQQILHSNSVIDPDSLVINFLSTICKISFSFFIALLLWLSCFSTWCYVKDALEFKTLLQRKHENMFVCLFLKSCSALRSLLCNFFLWTITPPVFVNKEGQYGHFALVFKCPSICMFTIDIILCILLEKACFKTSSTKGFTSYSFIFSLNGLTNFCSASKSWKCCIFLWMCRYCAVVQTAKQ